jgi:hypothetical protein
VTVLAHHLVWTAYGTWLGNDPRGSGSRLVYTPELAELGESHFGRRKEPPPRRVVHEFYQRANSRLLYPAIRFDDVQMQEIGHAFADVIFEAPLHVLRLRDHAGPRASGDSQAPASWRGNDRALPTGVAVSKLLSRWLRVESSDLDEGWLESVSRFAPGGSRSDSVCGGESGEGGFAATSVAVCGGL